MECAENNEQSCLIFCCCVVYACAGPATAGGAQSTKVAFSAITTTTRHPGNLATIACLATYDKDTCSETANKKISAREAKTLHRDSYQQVTLNILLEMAGVLC